MTWLAPLLKIFAKIVPLLALWLANLAGQRTGEARRDAQQNAINAKAREEYEKIEQKERNEWLDG